MSDTRPTSRSERDLFEEAAFKQRFMSSIVRTKPGEFGPVGISHMSKDCPTKAEFLAKDSDGQYIEATLNPAWWAWQAAIKSAASENESPVPAGIVQTYTAKIERDAVIIKTLRDKLVELCDRLNWKGPGRESNIEITVREARAIVKSFDQIAAAVAFITDAALGGQ